MSSLTFQDLAFELHRSPTRRTAEIQVGRDGALILAAPQEMPVDALKAVVAEKSMWIYTQLARKEALSGPALPKEYVSGEGFHYLGRSYRLRLVDSDAPQPALRLYRSRFELRRNAQSEGRKLFICWYTDQLSRRLPPQVTTLARRLGIELPHVHIRDLGFRWGSRGRKDDVYFHWRLAMLPPTIIEYVVAHELVHLLERRHTERYWQRLERLIPDYVERSRWLAENGARLSL